MSKENQLPNNLDALNAILEETEKLIGREDIPSDVKESIMQIHAIARYRIDVRPSED